MIPVLFLALVLDGGSMDIDLEPTPQEVKAVKAAKFAQLAGSMELKLTSPFACHSLIDAENDLAIWECSDGLEKYAGLFGWRGNEWRKMPGIFTLLK